MGCDIHLHLEYSFGVNKADGTRYWSYMGELHPGRNYGVFAGMAGVRGKFDWSFQPKGYPKDLGWWAASELFMHVVPDEETPMNKQVCKTQADKWVSYGYSTRDPLQVNNPNVITNPDYHSASWLTTQEFALVIHNLNKADEDGTNYVDTTYTSILAMMQTLEASGNICRLVFAFDN